MIARLSLIVFGFWLVSCEVINPADPVPSYLYIDDLVVETSFGEGSNSSQLTEAWLYVNGEFLGSYSTPATVPVIASGPTEIILFPGIRINGIKALPDIYPFYETVTFNRDLIPATVDTLRAKTGYPSTAKFSLLEGFEVGSVFAQELDGDPETKIEVISDDVFEGLRSGKITLSAEHPNFESSTVIKLTDIPLNGTEVYMEMDYKCDIQFAIGLVGVPDFGAEISNYFFILRPKEEWNKIYIQLSEEIFNSQFPAYRVAIAATHPSDFSGSESQILLDNIKLVHF